MLNFFAIVGAGVFMQGLGFLMKALYPASMLSHEAFVSDVSRLLRRRWLAGAVLYAFTRESMEQGSTGDKNRQ